MFSFLCRQKLHISALSGGCCVLLLLTACHATFPTKTDEGIGFREERHAEITAMQNYRECLDEAAILDSKARQAGSFFVARSKSQKRGDFKGGVLILYPRYRQGHTPFRIRYWQRN